MKQKTMFGKIFRRIFRKKVKISKEERFEALFADATKVSPEWVKRQETKLTEVARREDTVTDATIVIYRDRHGMTLSCQFQRSGKKARTPKQ